MTSGWLFFTSNSDCARRCSSAAASTIRLAGWSATGTSGSSVGAIGASAGLGGKFDGSDGKVGNGGSTGGGPNCARAGVATTTTATVASTTNVARFKAPPSGLDYGEAHRVAVKRK